MATVNSDDVLKLPDWLVHVCKSFWKQRGFFWGTVVFGLILNIIASLGFTDPSSFNNLPIHFLFRYWLAFFIVGIALWLCTLFVGLVSRLGASSSIRDVKRSYLRRMANENQVLQLKGIPAGLIADSVRMDEVFIPLQLRPNRPKADYPLTDEELALHKKAIASGIFPKDLDKVVLEAEKNWQYILKKTDRISIADMWNQLSDEHPAAVIQGFPGMGKSTLMERLALHMARRGLLQNDLDMLEQERFGKPFIPILLRLREYAEERKKNEELPLSEYVKLVCNELRLPDALATAPFIQKSLMSGSCLVMFDGLDEVSDPLMRLKVQEAIRAFVKECRDTPGNRFFITSRVAGYDLEAFPDNLYLHYTLAELDDEQIEYFLPRWCHANAHRYQQTPSQDGLKEQKAAIEQAVERKVSELHNAINENLQVRELAENPLLLTLLVVMQQNSIVLPRERVELYRTVTTTLLQNRNIAKGLPVVQELHAIKLLGPLAFQMQETGNSFARERDVIESLQETIAATSGGTPEEVATQADTFLNNIRERGGLFVQRTGDYFGFMHRTFQEYFAARHVLNKIKINQEDEIKTFVAQARREDDLWHVPFVLAVAYQSTENEYVASDILNELLTIPAQCDTKNRLRYLSLATECIVESKPLSIDAALERRVAEQLLHIYMGLLQQKDFETCTRIETIIRRWLLSLPNESFNRPLLLVLAESIRDNTKVRLQRSTLTLLTLIAQQLVEGPSTIFTMLVPILLRLADLPDVPGFLKPNDLAPSSNFDIIDLALTTLSFMGERGPAGVLLAQTKQDFSPYLLDLARYSLESLTLITPTVIPFTQKNFREYEQAVGQWLTLRNKCEKRGVAKEDIQACCKIQELLFASAEEVRYPTVYHLLNMLKLSQDSNDWRQSWQRYMLDTLRTGRYIDYQQIALLWTMLFPQQESITILATTIKQHLVDPSMLMQRNAQRCIATLAEDLSYLMDLSYLRDLMDLRNLRDLSYLRNLMDLRNLRNLMDLRNLRDSRDLRDLRNLSYLSYLRDLMDLSYLRDSRDLRDLKNLRNLRNLLLIEKTSADAINALSLADTVQNVDVLIILLGRILQIQEADEEGSDAEREIRRIVQVANDGFFSANDDEVKEAALDVLRYLPVRSAAEITFVLQLAQGATQERLQKAYVSALRRANGNTPEKTAALEVGKTSSIEAVRDAVKYALS